MIIYLTFDYDEFEILQKKLVFSHTNCIIPLLSFYLDLKKIVHQNRTIHHIKIIKVMFH